MKKILIIALLGLSFSVHAQSETIQAMAKQIALIQVYIGYIQKGYKIAKKGLNTIGDIKDGHWKLDIDYFNSLKKVNTKIKSYAKVAAILSEQVAIVKECGRLKRQGFNKDETEYVASVVRHLLNECEAAIDQLSLVLSNGELQMSDDERIQVIDKIYDDMQEQYSFIRSFSGQAKVLIQQLAKETRDIKVSQKLRGL